MLPHNNIRNLLNRFARAEDGWATVFFLFLVMVVLTMGGLSLDYSSGVERRAHLQAAADAVALAAVIDLPDTSAATASGLAIADLFFTGAGENGSIGAADFTYGNWDQVNGLFLPNQTPFNMVQVLAARRTDRNNAVPTFLLHLVGHARFDINVAALARAKGDVSCRNGGFFSDHVVLSGSNNDYVNGFCLYGHDKVKVGSDNSFELGVQVVMEYKINLEQGGYNAGLEDAIIEDTYTLPLPDLVDDIVANAFANPALMLAQMGLPDFIKYGPITLPEITDTTILAPYTLYAVDGVADLGSDRTLSNIAIIASQEVKVGSNNVIYNAVFSTHDKILLGSNNVFGHPSGCANGRYDTYMFSGSNIEFGTDNFLRAVQMGAKGEIKLGSDVAGIEEVYGEARGNFDYGSADIYGGCLNGLVSDFGIQSKKESSEYVRFALYQ